MKEITREIKKEIVETQTLYQASDGTEFTCAEECRKYENSAAGVLLTKTKGFELTRQGDSSWFDDSDDNEYRTLVPQTDKDIDVLNQLWYLFGGKRNEDPKFKYEDKGSCILMGIRMYDHVIDWLWFYKFNEFVNSMTDNKYKIVPVGF